MRSYATTLVASATVMMIAGTSMAGGNLCWDNDIVPNGFNGRATSPPNFPDIRVTDDFTVGADGWAICDLHIASVDDGTWTRGDVAEIYVYSDAGGCPGSNVATVTTADWTAEFKGFQLFSRDVYNYWFNYDCVQVEGGAMYHIGTRFPNAGGTGTTYWLTSNGGQGTDKTGCFSLDGGATWTNEGTDWHHAFELTGVCEQACTPCFGDLDEDCDVDFQDLLRLLAGWGPCDGGQEGNCDAPGDCDRGFESCQDVCFCFSLPDGTGFCAESTGCAGLVPCPGGQGDCPSGQTCIVGTCCGDPDVCIPDELKCEGGSPSAPPAPGTFTTTGIAQ